MSKLRIDSWPDKSTSARCNSFLARNLPDTGSFRAKNASDPDSWVSGANP
jgi:hypothetical protein